MLVHTLGTSWHQHVVAQVVLLTHLSSPNAATLKHDRLFVCLACPSNATRRLRCTCLHASHLLVLPCGAWAQLFTHPPFPSNVMWPEHIYVPTCCVSAVSSDGPGMPAYVPSISWGSHLLAGACLNFYLSSVPELTCSNSKSPVHIIGTTVEFQQCHIAPRGTFLYACYVSVPPHGGVEVSVHACQAPGLGGTDIPVCAGVLSQR